MTTLRSELEEITSELVEAGHELSASFYIPSSFQSKENPRPDLEKIKEQAISSLESLIEKREKALMHEIIDLHNEPGFGTDFDGIAEEVIKRAGYKPELRGDTNE